MNLSYKDRINEMCHKLSRSVGILYKFKSFFPEDVFKNLYYTLVHPYLNYNIELWFGASEYMLEKVRALQRKSLRAIFNLPYNHHTFFFQKTFVSINQTIFKSLICPCQYSTISIIQLTIKILLRTVYLLIHHTMAIKQERITNYLLYVSI